jgi:hypothetical protein
MLQYVRILMFKYSNYFLKFKVSTALTGVWPPRSSAIYRCVPRGKRLGCEFYFVQRRSSKLLINRIRIEIRQMVLKRLTKEDGVFRTFIQLIYRKNKSPVQIATLLLPPLAIIFLASVSYRSYFHLCVLCIRLSLTFSNSKSKLKSDIFLKSEIEIEIFLSMAFTKKYWEKLNLRFEIYLRYIDTRFGCLRLYLSEAKSLFS